MSVTREQREELREAMLAIADEAWRGGERGFSGTDPRYQAAWNDMEQRCERYLAAILDAPAPEGWVEVEHWVTVESNGTVLTGSVEANTLHVVHPGFNEPVTRSHRVRVRYRVPLPPKPLTVEGEVVR